MTGFMANLMLALIWGILTGGFNPPNLLLGFAVAFLALGVLGREVASLRGYHRSFFNLVCFVLYFVTEMFRANLKVAFDILTPPWHMQPGVIALRLEAKTDFEISLVANLISLTPGTLSLDVSDDRTTLYIHAMFLENEQEVRDQLKYFERRVLQLVRRQHAE